jgi:hypothetical protein
MEGTQPIEMGINFWTLDLETTQKANTTKWKKHLARKSDKLDKLKLPEDFNYLLPGTYIIEISRGAHNVQTRFLVE